MPNEAFLQRLCSAWSGKMKLAKDHKREVFGNQAEECLRFYNTDHRFIYNPRYWDGRAQWNRESGEVVQENVGGAPYPSLKVCVNKTAQYVQVYGPFLYFQNPTRTVKARKFAAPPPEVFGIDPMTPAPPPNSNPMMWTPQQQMYGQYQMAMQADQLEERKRTYKASLMEDYLNYTPNELDLKNESQHVIDEALIKGRGVSFCNLWQSRSGGPRMPYTAWDSVDNLLLDPDSEKLREAQWCAQQCCEPYWVLADRYGIPREEMKKYAKRESMNQQGATSAYDLGIHHRKVGATADSIVYYRIWSRMGMGARLNQYDDDLATRIDSIKEFDNCFLVVAEGVPFPLNWHPNMSEPSDILEAVRWPIEFWRDDIHPWPFAELDFCWNPRSIWPIAPLSFAMGFQMFLDWGYSAIASKMVRTCRDGILYDASKGADLLEEFQRGMDMWIKAVNKGPGAWDEFIKVIQMPPMNPDLWHYLELAEKQFEDHTGLSDIMRGMSPHQYRSAEEAKLKGDFARLRPDDMANRTGHWMSLAARKEGLAGQWELKPVYDIQPIFGQTRAMAWSQLIECASPENPQGQDPNLAARELDYRIEAGSSKRPNIEAEIQNTEVAAQFMAPNLLTAWQTSGDPGAWNHFMNAWAKPRGMDGEMLTLPPLMPPPPPTGGEGQPKKQESQPKKKAA